MVNAGAGEMRKVDKMRLALSIIIPVDMKGSIESQKYFAATIWMVNIHDVHIIYSLTYWCLLFCWVYKLMVMHRGYVLRLMLCAGGTSSAPPLIVFTGDPTLPGLRILIRKLNYTLSGSKILFQSNPNICALLLFCRTRKTLSFWFNTAHIGLTNWQHSSQSNF